MSRGPIALDPPKRFEENTRSISNQGSRFYSEKAVLGGGTPFKTIRKTSVFIRKAFSFSEKEEGNYLWKIGRF